MASDEPSDGHVSVAARCCNDFQVLNNIQMQLGVNISVTDWMERIEIAWMILDRGGLGWITIMAL